MILMLALLEVKHYLFDFHWQTPKMLAGKGVLGNRWGVAHSGLHAMSTLVILLALAPSFWWLAFAEFAVHYGVDYMKARYGIKDASRTLFWKQLGLDQLAHQLTYVAIAAIAFGGKR